VIVTFGLLPVLPAAENVEVPLRLFEWPVAERAQRVEEMLEFVGLGDRSRHRPTELSGGEQQRVAIARALAGGPELLIADEPTGQLDSRTGASIMHLPRRLAVEQGLTAVVATHDDQVIESADRRVELSDGRIAARHVDDPSAPAP
jgi:putative ABC transport system ATP-binding protein